METIPVIWMWKILIQRVASKPRVVNYWKWVGWEGPEGTGSYSKEWLLPLEEKEKKQGELNKKVDPPRWSTELRKGRMPKERRQAAAAQKCSPLTRPKQRSFLEGSGPEDIWGSGPWTPSRNSPGNTGSRNSGKTELPNIAKKPITALQLTKGTERFTRVSSRWVGGWVCNCEETLPSDTLYTGEFQQ